MGIAERIEQSDQRADQGRIKPADFVVRLNAFAGCTGADGVA